jgi:hypothetical protein
MTNAVQVAGVVTASNGKLPIGYGTRTFNFSNASWQPTSTISLKNDYETFFIGADGLIIIMLSAQINNRNCFGLSGSYLVLYDLNRKEEFYTWETLMSDEMNQLQTFYATASSQYQLKLRSCPSGESSADHVSITWLQPGSS